MRLGRYREQWCVVWYEDGKRRRHTLGTADKAEAERRLKQLHKPQGKTVADLWQTYCEEKEGRRVVDTMHWTGKSLLPHFGHLEAHEIDLVACRDYTVGRRRQGRSDGTIHTELGHLRMVLNWAVKRGHIERAPHIERPAKPEPKDRYLTREEAQRLLDGAAMHHIRLAIILLLATAARVEAIRELTWDRVDFDRGLVHLRDPQDKTRRKGRATVPMNRSARVALLQAKETALTDYVIEWAGKPVQSIRRGLDTAARNAGLAGVSAHVLRHTAAVWLAEAGRPMAEIAQFLGHSNSRVTERVYARFSPDHLRAPAEVLEIGTIRRKA